MVSERSTNPQKRRGWEIRECERYKGKVGGWFSFRVCVFVWVVCVNNADPFLEKASFIMTKCPYCDFEIERKITRKKKCTSCGNYIYVRDRKPVTNDIAQEIDLLKYLKSYGITKDDFDQKRKELSTTFGKIAGSSDVAWGLYNDLVISSVSKDNFI